MAARGRETGIYERQTKRGTVYDAVGMVDGKQKWSRGHRTKTEAREARDAMRVAMRRGQMGAAPARLTVRDYLDNRWWPYIQNELRSSESVRSYKSQLRHVHRHLGGARLLSLAPLDIEQFKTDMRSAGVGEAMQNAAFDRLRQALNDAVRWELIWRNPCDRVKAPREPEHVAPVLSVKDVEAMLTVAYRTTDFGALFYLAALTGMRWGELTSLRWADIDFAAGVLSIPRANTKTDAGRRRIAVGRKTLARLRAHRWEQMRRYRDLGATKTPVLVFTTKIGTALTQANFHNRVWGPLRDRLGLPEMHFHDLRHVNTTLLAKAGVHPAVMKERLGHADASMALEVYTDLQWEDQKPAAVALEQMLERNKR